MPVISCMPKETLACLAAAPGTRSYCAPLDQHPKLSQYWLFWTAWHWFLGSVSIANLLFPFPSPWEGSAACCAPNVPVLGSLGAVPVLQEEQGCSATLPWHSQASQGCQRHPHMALWGCRGTAGAAGLGTARVTGDKGGDVQVLWPRMCSGLPPSPWFEGLPCHVLQLRVLRGSQSPACSALLTPLPRRPAQQEFILP